MTLRSLISPIAVAGVLALGSALPASAAIFGGDAIIQFRQAQPIDQSSLTPAERTALEDQCRQKQATDRFDDADNPNYASTSLRATAAYCSSIGLPS